MEIILDTEKYVFVFNDGTFMRFDQKALKEGKNVVGRYWGECEAETFEILRGSAFYIMLKKLLP